MRALQFTAYGGPEVLHWADAPEPHAGPGQVRVAVRAASVNPIDWKVFSGIMPGGGPLEGPGRVGRDAAGVVDEVGEGVTGVSVGDEVFGLGSDAVAEHAVLRAWAAKPASVVGVSCNTSSRTSVNERNSRRSSVVTFANARFR